MTINLELTQGKTFSSKCTIKTSAEHVKTVINFEQILFQTLPIRIATRMKPNSKESESTVLTTEIQLQLLLY